MVFQQDGASRLYFHIFIFQNFPQKCIDSEVLSLVHLIPLTVHDFIFLLEYIKDAVYIPTFLSNLPGLAGKIKAAVVTDLLP